MILGTAGHIDHGKTALVRALTGVDTDRLPEEKRRGITIDLGFAPLQLDGVGTIGIVDVPGHEGFVRTMVAGSSGIDLAMLVIAADEGIMPQTREHLEILSLLDIRSGVVALTKCDLAEAEWRQLVADEVRSLLERTPLHGAEIIQVSSLTGEGLPELKAAIIRAALAVRRQERSHDLFRMPVDRAFTIKGTGTVVTGTIWSGSVARDSVLRIEPGARPVRVRAIQSHGNVLDRAVPGMRAALALAGCDLSDVGRGSSLISEDTWIPTHEIDVSLSLTVHEFKPAPRTRVRLHIGTSETGARLSRLRPLSDGHHSARLILDDAVIARGGDRFVIRLSSPTRTVGGGVVVDPFPPRRVPPKQRMAMEEIPAGSDQHLIAMLENAGQNGVPIQVLPVRTGLSPIEVTAALARIDATVVGGHAWSSSSIAELQDFIETFLSTRLATNRLDSGVSLQTLRAASRAPEEVMDFLLDRLKTGGRIEVDGSTVRPAGWVSSLSSGDEALRKSILHEICIEPAQPPSVAELEAKFGSTTRAMLRMLERDGALERVAEDRFYGRDAAARMIEALRTSLAPGRSYSPAELREVLGVSRKYLIPFLEFCDRQGITERTETGRVMRQQSSKTG